VYYLFLTSYANAPGKNFKYFASHTEGDQGWGEQFETSAFATHG
jgi:hypothetical protein